MAAPGEAQQLLRHVGGDRGIGDVLDIVAVDGEGGQAPLGVGGHHRGQVHRAGALGAVKAPHRLDGLGVHVEGLGAVAPAPGDGQGGHHVLGGELVRHTGGLGPAADGGAADDALHRGAVGVLQILADEGGGASGHGHGLLLQALPDAAPAPVDDGPDADLRIQHSDKLLLL